jgi:arsenite oxidase small subunit
MLVTINGRWVDLRKLTRREFVQITGVGAAALSVAGLPAASPAASPTATGAEYPVIDVAPLSSLGPADALPFTYPDENSPALLLRLAEPAVDGVGPNREIVAYSILCTHKGCPVSFKPEQRMLICPCHWSTFDPAKSGSMVIGQASQPLPRIELRVEGDMVRAAGIVGLIYGRYTNIL